MTVRRDGDRSSHHRRSAHRELLLGVQRTQPGTATYRRVDRSTKMIPTISTMVGNSEIHTELAHLHCQEEGFAPGEPVLLGERQCDSGYLAGWKGWLNMHTAVQRYTCGCGVRISWFLLHSFWTMTVTIAINHICTMN